MTKKKIVWAVDLFSDNVELQKKSARQVVGLAKKLGARVIPTSVLSPLPFLFHPNLSLPDGRKYRAEKKEVRTALEKRAATFGVKPVERCEVLLAPEASLRSEVDTLIKFAQAESAEMIVLSTHARKTAERFFLGSFAETLLLKSPVPLMLVQPATEASGSIKRILFPTDFSVKSKNALSELESLAKSFGATIQLFHHLEYMTPAFSDNAISQSRVQSVMKEMCAEMKREKALLGRTWVSDLKTRGVKATFMLSEMPVYTVEAILKYAHKFDSDLLAVASETNRGVAEIIGGVARRLVRKATLPVWIVHPGETAVTNVISLPRNKKLARGVTV